MKTMEKNYYEVLGVSKDANQDDIKSAYRKLALKTHPDSGGEEEEFKQINEAYGVLSNPEKRQAYDTYGSADARNYNGNMPGGDIFSWFNNMGNRRRPDGPTPYKGSDIIYDISLTLEELSTKDFSKEITYDRQDKCQSCDNSGMKTGKKPSNCASCNGTGRFVRRSVSGNMRMEQIVGCPSCNGSGQAILDEDKCGDCNGVGTVSSKRVVSVNIPRGIGEVTMLVLQSQGNSGVNKGPNGDLGVRISIEPHSVFRRQGNDLYITYQISIAQAILGCSVELPTIFGNYITLDIPPATKHGTIFTKKTYGMHTYQNLMGDLHIEIHVNIPSKLSDEEKDQIKILKSLDSESCLVDNVNVENYLGEIKNDKKDSNCVGGSSTNEQKS